MFLVFLVWALLNGDTPTTIAATEVLPACTAPQTRTAVKSAVQDQLTLSGLPRELEAFQLLAKLQEASTDRAQAIEATLRQAGTTLDDRELRICEVDDPAFDSPMFVTVLVGGTPQLGGYVLNFGLPGITAIIGAPPK